MGTNYYLHEGVCPCCKRAAKELHVGKSSGGWTFSFRGYRAGCDPPIASYAEWQDYLTRAIAGGGEIRDEYGEVVSLDDFRRLVDSKRGERHNHTLYCREHHRDHARDCWLDEEGNSFTGTVFS